MISQANKYQQKYVEKFSIETESKPKQANNAKRYRIHKRLKGFLTIDSKNRTVFLPLGKVPVIIQKQIKTLQTEFNYQIQYVIK